MVMARIVGRCCLLALVAAIVMSCWTTSTASPVARTDAFGVFTWFVETRDFECLTIWLTGETKKSTSMASFQQYGPVQLSIILKDKSNEEKQNT
ncbi:hypothetical protein OUZ56_001953 [Daphnia magna]|uniref:Secreted protein n=1 Tax=Daphnia magna TaxID=35525 RepID=A0ABR0A487_9CRUS|nr:hypothetical protein OUZ56_001953 [Daphnia magna]